MSGKSGGGGGGSSTTTTVKNELDPTVRPYVEYGLGESKRLYQTGGPDYYSGQTYAPMSADTRAALAATSARAVAGSPLVGAAQASALKTLKGDYLAPSPFFAAAFNPAAEAAKTRYQDTTRDVLSNTSKAGRYGSDAMAQMLQRADQAYATALTDTAGKLAYDNYADERTRQAAAITGAPQLAGADYADMAQRFAAGQTQESYDQAAIDEALQRFNYEQDKPYSKLQNFLSAAYGAPMGMQTTQPIYRNQLGGALGGGALGYSLGGPVGAGIGAIGGGLLA